jgi:hypothetical protein
MANKVNFACISASIGGNFRKRPILHFTRMRFKRCRVGCHRSYNEGHYTWGIKYLSTVSLLPLEEIPASFTLRTLHHENSLGFMESNIGYASLESWELTMLCGFRYCSCSYEILRTHYALWSQIWAMLLWNHKNSLGSMKYVLFLSILRTHLDFWSQI